MIAKINIARALVMLLISLKLSSLAMLNVAKRKKKWYGFTFGQLTKLHRLIYLLPWNDKCDEIEMN